MGERSLNTRIQNKIDTTANWAKATNFVPKKGEIIVYSDGGGTGIPKIKVGDGSTVVGSLKFIQSDGNLPTARKISIGGGATATTTSAAFDGTKDITIPLGAVYGSYLSWGGRSIAGSVSPIDAAMSYMHSANRLQFANPAGIAIEYSTDNGSTWVDYEASNEQKIALVSGLASNMYLGKRTSGLTATTDALRITLNATKCGIYSTARALLVNFNSAGASGCKIGVETSIVKTPTAFISYTTQGIGGWPAWNSYPLNLDRFGGASNQIAAIRLTFTVGTASTSSTQRTAVSNLLLLGEAAWATPSNMANTGHLYSWDASQNAAFPADITATKFNGPATSVSNSLSINGKSYNGSVAVDIGTIGAEYGGTGKTSLRASANALINDLDTSLTTPYDADYFISQYTGGGTTTTTYHRRPMSALYAYMKGKMDSVYQAKGTYLSSLPIASSTTLGGVKIGSGLTVAEDGTISAAAAYTLPTASSTTKGGIKVGTGLTMSSETLNHSNSITAKASYGSTATTASANGGSITVTDVKYDAQGHITGSTDRKITLSQTTYTLAGLMGSTAKGSATQPIYWNGTAWTNTTYTLGKSVPADAKFTDTVYTLPTASSSTLGGVKTTSTVSSASGYTACPIINGVVYYKDTNSTYTLAGLVGSTAIGTATNPIYWDGSKFVKTTYTLGKSVPSDAKFTDTVYTLPIATSSTLGGVKVGTGLQINSSSGELSVQQVPNSLTINGTSYNGSKAVDITIGSPQSETISIATTDWSGSGPYTATKTLTNTYDSTTHDVIISLPQMSSSDVDKYDAIASAKMVISACDSTSITLVALGDKPEIPVSVAIMQV